MMTTPSAASSRLSPVSLLLLLLLAITLPASASTVPVNLRLDGSGSATAASGGQIFFTVNGNATVSPLGSGTWSGSGSFTQGVVATSPISGDITISFQGGSTLKGSFKFPAGILVPQLGNVASASGTITITSGTGTYAGVTGLFPNVTGSGTATGITSATVTLQGAGTLNLPSPAPTFTVSTAAGNGHILFGGDGLPAITARLIQPQYVVTDPSGITYFSDSYYAQVFSIDTAGNIHVFAGTGVPGNSGDEGPATSAQLSSPMGLAIDANGALYIADSGAGRIRQVTSDGVIHTFANNLPSATGLAIDPATGILYLTQPSKNIVQAIDPTGNATVFAGTGIAGDGTAGLAKDGVPATQVNLLTPTGVAVDSLSNVYITDQNTRIRRIATDGTMSTFAGSGATAPTIGDGGPALAATLSFPTGLAMGWDGTLYVADGGSGRIRAVTPDGNISTLAGGGASLADGSATDAYLSFPNGLAIDPRNGALVAAIRISRQIRYLAGDGSITTLAGVEPSGYSIDGGNATADISLLGEFGLAVDSKGNLFVSDSFDNRILRVDPTGITTTFAGNSLFGAPANGKKAVILGSPWGLSFSTDGTLLVSAGVGESVFRLDSNAVSTLVAGGNGFAATGDGGQATKAAIGTPVSVVDDTKGGFYICDSTNHRVRHVDSKGVITAVAGNGTPSASALNTPWQVAVDSQGNLYIADSGNYRVRMVAAADGKLTTIAGTGTAGFAGDNGPAANATMQSPYGVAVDKANNLLFIAEGPRVRMVDLTTLTITTIAGSAPGGFAGDGGPATAGKFFGLGQLAVDAAGNVYVSDAGNYRIRLLTRK